MKHLIFFMALFVIFTSTNAQIMYNIDKPISYKQSQLLSIDKVPTIQYDIDENGNFFENNIAVNLKNYMSFEKIGKQNIARIKFSINATSLGEITLRLNDVTLENGSYCYVYTKDYQIVAGPIYQHSIIDLLNIVKIPAKELILEVVYVQKRDFNLKLESLSFQTKAKSTQLTVQLDDIYPLWGCDPDEPKETNDYYNNPLTCQWLVGKDNHPLELFENPYLTAINDNNIDASRAACIVMAPDRDNNNNYTGEYKGGTATLINFPDSDCDGTIIGSQHVWELDKIFLASKALLKIEEGESVTESEDRYIEDMDNIIIRFNWHHRYGIPWHLQNIDCSASPANFELWRNTINFDEVIDYCGALGWAKYGMDGVPTEGDFIILKMKQHPIYKELHLGWSTQKREFSNDNELYSILGRWAWTPTYLYKSFFVEHDYGNGIFGRSSLKIRNAPHQYSSFQGWSGSQLLFQPNSDTYKRVGENREQRIGIGIMDGTSGTSINSVNYTTSHICYYYGNIFFKVSYMDLIDITNNTESLFDAYLQHHLSDLETGTINGHNFYWMPSLPNKEKCPSDRNEECLFDIRDYITCFPVEGSIIVSFDVNNIDVNDFPDPNGVYPAGIRIYHNSGDQTTFYFNSWADNQNIANNGKISFIISQADVFYYYNNGFDGIELGFDFYDSDGKIYGHSDCDYTYKIPFDSNVPTASDIVLCDFINISSVMTEVGTGPEENCCKHKLEIKFHSNIGQQPFYLIDQIITALNSEINVPNVGTVTLNADYHNVIVNGERINGIIVSDEFEICEETIIDLHFEINGKICDKNITINCDVPTDCCEVFYLDFVMPSVCPECSVPDLGFLSIRQSEEISGCEIIDVIFEIKEPNGSIFNLPFDLGTNFPNSGNLVSGGIFDFTACIENGVGNYTFTFTIITSQGNCVISGGVNVSNDSNGVPHGVVYWW